MQRLNWFGYSTVLASILYLVIKLLPFNLNFKKMLLTRVLSHHAELKDRIYTRNIMYRCVMYVIS